MPAAARYMDESSGAGTSGWPNVQGSKNVFINDLSVHRLGDVWAGNLGITVTGSSTVFVNNVPLARISDSVSRGGVIVTGSPNVYAGG